MRPILGAFSGPLGPVFLNPRHAAGPENKQFFQHFLAPLGPLFRPAGGSPRAPLDRGSWGAGAGALPPLFDAWGRNRNLELGVGSHGFQPWLARREGPPVPVG